MKNNKTTMALYFILCLWMFILNFLTGKPFENYISFILIPTFIFMLVLFCWYVFTCIKNFREIIQRKWNLLWTIITLFIICSPGNLLLYHGQQYFIFSILQLSVSVIWSLILKKFNRL